MSREGFFMFGRAGGEILGQTKEGKICYQGSEVWADEWVWGLSMEM